MESTSKLTVWFPIAMGVLFWAGLVLRTPRLRALLSTPHAA